MRLAVRREPFDHPDWIYELKLDGFQALACIEDGACRLISRNQHVYKSFQPLSANLADIISPICKTAVLDGEIVCLDSNGCPQFDQLFYRRGEPYFYAFDVPYLDGRDLRELPLLERKRILRGIVPNQLSDSSRQLSKDTDLKQLRTQKKSFPVRTAKNPLVVQPSRLLYVSHVDGRGSDLFQEVCRQDLEGIVAKWKDGPYVSGDVTSWIKIKNPEYSQAIGRWERFQRRGTARESGPTLHRASTA
jgi:bifunctional non-homologous end joining protein LigD